MRKRVATSRTTWRRKSRSGPTTPPPGRISIRR